MWGENVEVLGSGRPRAGDARRWLRRLPPTRRCWCPVPPTPLAARIVADCAPTPSTSSGAGIANWSLGVPDLRLTTMTDVLTEVARICRRRRRPGGRRRRHQLQEPVERAAHVREFERGVAAIQPEGSGRLKRRALRREDVIPARRWSPGARGWTRRLPIS
jgi:hypothetical protein